MTKSFDEILKEGKSNASTTQSNSSPAEWRHKIKVLMNALHDLNDFYEDDKTNHISVEPKKCSGCGKASYILITKNIRSNTQKIRFYHSGWKRDKDKYTCDKCSV